MSDAPHPLRFDDFELDEGNARLSRAGRDIPLPPKAFALLCALSRQPGRLATKDALLDMVWGHRHVSESVLKTTIGQVRAALADDAEQPRYIETVSRRGYRFIARLQTVALSPASAPAPAQAAVPMIGRAAALGRLHGIWSRAVHGQRQLVWIAGDAGIGKTTLIDRFIAETGAEHVAHGQCVEQFGAGEPYMPVLEALKILCRRHPDLAVTLRQVAPTWLLQLPWLVPDGERAVLHAQLAGATQERMVREFWELMEQHTQRTPLLLVTEDLHWSDHGTLRLMDHFARRRGQMRLLWIASFRLTQVIAEEHPLQQLRQELQMHRLCEEILLDPFSEAELAEYVETRAPAAAASESFIKRLHAHTDGLPLFVLNVIDSLVSAEGRRPPGEWAEAGALPIPDNLTGAIEKQVARLPDRTRTVLEIASVCGAEFSAETVADLSGIAADEVTRCCAELVRQKYWLRETDVLDLPDGSLDAQFAFRHVLYKHVFYRRIALSQRAILHRRLAQVLERRRAGGVPVTFAELASHQEMGREYFAALASYAEAAKSALAHFAPQEAIDITGHALSLLLHRCPDGPQRQELELSLLAHRGIASAHLFGVSSPESVQAFDRVRELCDVLPQSPARALLLNGLGWGFYTRGEYAQALAMSERVRAVAEQFDDRLLFATACNLMAVTLGTQGRYTASTEWAQKGLQMCQQLGEQLRMPAFLLDPDVSMRANIALPLAQLGRDDEARAYMAQALSRAQRLGQPMARMLALWCACLLYVRLDEPEQVERYARELHEFVAAADLRQGLGPSIWFRGWVAARRGEKNAHALILQGYECHERLGMYGGCTEVLGYAAEALLMEERWDEAHAQLAQALGLADRLGEGSVMTELLILKARIAAGRGERDAARQALDQALGTARAAQAQGCERKALLALERIEA